MHKRIRQYAGILTAAAAYYLIHEGAHWLTAVSFGAFKQIRFLGMGIQIDIYRELLTDTQLGIFCLAGAIATFLAGWLLIFLTGRICRAASKVYKAVMWYVTLAMLLPDPLYLSILCGFFGGGDMNGISLLFPESPARITFGVIGIIHGIIIWKYLLPVYRSAFSQT